MEHLLHLLAGLGSMNLSPAHREYPKPQGFAQDAENLRGDWRRVGNDLRETLRRERDTRQNGISAYAE
jgi:hypothetical protein